MDEIIRLVLERLASRAQANISVDVNDSKKQTESALLYHKFVTIEGLTQGHLNTLQNGTRVPWVQWLDLAIAFDCEVTLKCAIVANSLLSPSMVIQWPVIFRDKLGRRIYSFDESWISATAIRNCESGAVILLYRGQKLTGLAKDEASLCKVTVVEGNEHYASR
jgi:microcompartment protein PduM